MKQLDSYLLFSLLPFLLTSCQTSRVSTQSDPQFEMANYRSFAIFPFKLDEEARRAGPVVLDTIKTTIASELEAKGMTESELEKADLIVVVDGEIARRYRVRPQIPDSSFNPSRSIAFETERYYDGKLSIAMVDRGKGNRVWLGWIAENARGPVPDPERVAKAIREILTAFPPH